MSCGEQISSPLSDVLVDGSQKEFHAQEGAPQRESALHQLECTWVSRFVIAQIVKSKCDDQLTKLPRSLWCGCTRLDCQPDVHPGWSRSGAPCSTASPCLPSPSSRCARLTFPGCTSHLLPLPLGNPGWVALVIALFLFSQSWPTSSPSGESLLKTTPCSTTSDFHTLRSQPLVPPCKLCAPLLAARV